MEDSDLKTTSNACKSCGTTSESSINMGNDLYPVEYIPINGNFCRKCLNEMECEICLAPTSWAVGAKQCICCRVFCANCFKNSEKLTRVSCCDSFYCGKKSYCIAKICGHCNRCMSCFESNEGYVDFKQCATLECKSKICHFCCKSEFIGDLRYCNKCLVANEEFCVLRSAYDLRPGSDAVKTIEGSFRSHVLQSSYLAQAKE